MAPPSAPDGAGYWVVAADGGVFSYGDARFFGSGPGVHLPGRVVSLTPTPDGQGYWLATSAGLVRPFGDARLFPTPAGAASPAGAPSPPGPSGPAGLLDAPVVGLAATPDGAGYWVVAADGGVFSYGDARFFGSGPGVGLSGRVVSLTPTPDGQGYWLATSAGLVRPFGDARLFPTPAGPPGSAGAPSPAGTPSPASPAGPSGLAGLLDAPVVGLAATPDGAGYWVVAADGGVFSYGDARFFGSGPGVHLSGRVVSLTPTPDGQGYWLATSAGLVRPFGDARLFPAPAGTPAPGTVRGAPVVGLADPAFSPVADVPLQYLALDHQAAATCPGLPWAVLAGIGKVESDFGRSPLPGVAAGTNPFGAAGPMQMGIGGASGPTFFAYDQPVASDGAPTPTPPGTSPPSPWNPADAVYAAARDLCTNGGGQPATLGQAIFAYNHSSTYVTEVESLASYYAGRGLPGNAVQLAMSQVGTPYLWGGTTPGVGFDCSGLVQWVYGRLGLTLPRTSQAQWAGLPHLPAGAPLSAGDLVFFGPAGGPTHVGLYVGNGLMVDAPHAGASVRVEGYQWPDYLGAALP